MEYPTEKHPAHPSTRTYVWVGLLLVVVTLVEVAVPYLLSARGLVVPLLLTLGAVKFAVVAAFYMHLRFDRLVLTWIFATGVALAVLVVGAMIIVMAA